MNRSMLFALIGAALVLSITLQAAAQTFHLITVADSKDVTIGKGAEANSLVASSYFNKVADALQMKFEAVRIDGGNGCQEGVSCFSCDAINNAVAHVQAAADDVIVFYYSGHGFRTKRSQSQFPSFYCSASLPLSSLPQLSDVAQTLAKKGARLVVAIADTCNLVVPLPPPAAPEIEEATRGSRSSQFKSLFNGYRGLLVMSSSVPTQASWYYPTGGLFTAQFFKAMDQATAPGRTGLWKDITVAATAVIRVDPGQGPPVVQTPQASDKNLVRIAVPR